VLTPTSLATRYGTTDPLHTFAVKTPFCRILPLGIDETFVDEFGRHLGAYLAGLTMLAQRPFQLLLEYLPGNLFIARCPGASGLGNMMEFPVLRHWLLCVV
jgi:hypothetical protein